MSTAVLEQQELYYEKGDSTTLKEFDELYELLFNRTWVVRGETYCLPELGWERIYGRGVRRLGNISAKRKKFTGVFHQKRVSISKLLLSRNLDKATDFEDTIRHEIAHAIDVERRGTSDHSHSWKMIAREVGANDNRLHEGFLDKPEAPYAYVCTNNECDFEAPRYRNQRKRRAGICPECHSTVEFVTK